jgi:hypothetical protein
MRETVHILLAVAALVFLFLLAPTPVYPGEITIPTGPCPNPWHPFIDDCRRWPV